MLSSRLVQNDPLQRYQEIQESLRKGEMKYFLEWEHKAPFFSPLKQNEFFEGEIYLKQNFRYEVTIRKKDVSGVIFNDEDLQINKLKERTRAWFVKWLSGF